MTSGQRASASDAALWWQAYQLAEFDREDELRLRAIAGDDHARCQLATWLADRGRTEDAIVMIRPLADVGNDLASLWLARWLAERDDAPELRRRAAAGDYHALRELAGWLARRQHPDELRELIASTWPDLAAWVAGQGDMHVVQVAADAGDQDARRRVQRWLASLRTRAAGGEHVARRILACWGGC